MAWRDHDLLKSALSSELQYSKVRYTCTKHPNSCSINIYDTYQFIFLLSNHQSICFFFLNSKDIYPTIFHFFFTFSSCSLTLLHIIYELILGNKYCKYLLVSAVHYLFSIHHPLKNGIRKNMFKYVPTESRNHSEDFVHSWSHWCLSSHF